jgi:hypothetical protein
MTIEEAWKEAYGAGLSAITASQHKGDDAEAVFARAAEADAAAIAVLRHHLILRTDGDDGELVERLRKMQRAPDGTILPWVVNPDGPEAAARITALSAEVERLRAVLGRFVDQARVGSGNKPVTRSSRVNCPSGIYHDARQALGAKPCSP